VLNEKKDLSLFESNKPKDWNNIIREMKRIFTVEETKTFERIFYFLADRGLFDCPRTTQLLVINRLLNEVRK
jgi:hypothetical protein